MSRLMFVSKIYLYSCEIIIFRKYDSIIIIVYYLQVKDRYASDKALCSFDLHCKSCLPTGAGAEIEICLPRGHTEYQG